MKIKKITAVMLLFCLTLCPLFPITSGVAEKSDFGQRVNETTQYENEGLRLVADPKTAEIKVIDKTTGYTWHSNPAGKENDAVASGFNKMNLFSQLVISYLDENGQTDSTNSYVGSVKKSDFYCEKISKGFRFVYNFASEGFIIPVEYTLSDQKLICNIPIRQIEEKGKDRINEIQVLPFFGAGEMNEEGYLLIPDGCGTLIRFNCSAEKVKTLTGYKESVYGRDPVLTTTTVTSRSERILLPMFGIKKAGGGFLAIIESGDALSQIAAVPNNKETSYAAASPILTYRNTDNAVLRERKSGEKNILVYDETPVSLENYTVSYNFISGAGADYSSMAAVAREYYEQNGMSEKAAYTGLYLELTGGDRMTDYFLGMPIKRYQPFTTLSQAKEILAYFNKNGIRSIAVKYDSFFRGGAYYKPTISAKPEKKLQDISFNKFLNSLENGNRIFPTVNFMNIYASGNGIYKNKSCVRNVSGGIFRGYPFLRSTYRKDISGQSYTIASASVFSKSVERYLTAMKKRGIENYADLTSGNTLPSDHHRSVFGNNRSTDRGQALEIHKEAYKNAKSESKYTLFDRACGYVFPYASDITSLPMNSSRYEIFAEDVPFVQMVLHGRVSYSSSAINLCKDPGMAVLKCLEYGNIPMFSLVYDGTELLTKSNYSDRFSNSYEYWKDRIVNYEKIYGSIFKEISGACIRSHTKIQESVYKTIYDNGVTVLINYGEHDVIVQNVVVKAGSFECFGG